MGGIIGGITNRIAIQMLFRPYNPVKVFGHTILQGLIPKRKGEIAKSIGGVVSTNLLNSEILQQTLLSDEMTAKVEQALDKLEAQLLSNPDSLQVFLTRYMQPQDLRHIVASVEDNIIQSIIAKVTDQTLGPKLAQMAREHIERSLQDNTFARLGMTLFGGVLDKLEQKIAVTINEMLLQNAPQMVSQMVDDEVSQLLNKPVKDLLVGKETQLARLKDMALNTYRTVVENNLPKILASINLQQVIEDRINSLEMPELERTILEVADRELKSLVWLGAFLGFLMGFLTNLI